jgi:hypothetical protein
VLLGLEKQGKLDGRRDERNRILVGYSKMPLGELGVDGRIILK